MTFPCNTKLFPLQPEIKYMSMETIYLGIVIFLFVLAIFDLVVGVSNDAVNFFSRLSEQRQHLSKPYCSLQALASSSVRHSAMA